MLLRRSLSKSYFIFALNIAIKIDLKLTTEKNYYLVDTY